MYIEEELKIVKERVRDEQHGFATTPRRAEENVVEEQQGHEVTPPRRVEENVNEEQKHDEVGISLGPG